MEQKQLIDQIFSEDDISWRTMIFDAVRTEEMDPWDVDIGTIAERFLAMLQSLKQMNLRLPGKVLLASALLLKMKSTRFLDVDMNNLDKLIAYTENDEPLGDEEDYYGDDDESEPLQVGEETVPKLVPRTPQPRKRKVSVYDLVKALEKALEVKQRRKVLSQRPHPKVELPNQIFDLTMVMNDVYGTIVEHYERGGQPLTFSRMLPEQASKEDKVFTFIPLLHLSNMQKVDLHQPVHFGDIEVQLLSKEKDISAEIEEHASEALPQETQQQ